MHSAIDHRPASGRQLNCSCERPCVSESTWLRLASISVMTTAKSFESGISFKLTSMKFLISLAILVRGDYCVGQPFLAARLSSRLSESRLKGGSRQECLPHATSGSYTQPRRTCP